jgi:hypothetical protein
MALNQKLVHVRPAYIFFSVAVASNAMLWMTCSAVWRMIRRHTQSRVDRYRFALAATCLAFVVQQVVADLFDLLARGGTVSVRVTGMGGEEYMLKATMRRQ